MTGRRSAALIIAAFVVACSPRADAPIAGNAAARDSAGITIVENSVPAWTENNAWTVDSTKPLVDIGTEGGEPAYQLHYVRAALQLRDGTIAVANMGTNQIRFYDKAGNFIKVAGRKGQGPGEFEQLWRLRKLGDDSLMALEPADLTSIFTNDGRFVRRFRLDPVNGYTNLWWLGNIDSGYLLVFSLARIGTREIAPNPERKLPPNVEEARISIPEKPAGYRDSLMHFLYTMDGHLIDTIGRMPSQWVGEFIVFAPSAAYAFDGPRFYHSPGDRFEIREYTLGAAAEEPATPSGARSRPGMKLTRIVRVANTRDLTATKADSQNYLDGMRAQFRRSERMSDADIEMQISHLRTPISAKLPAHANRMYIDPSHALWIQEFNSNEQAPARWTVVDSAGTYLGVVTSPARFNVMEIGSNYVLGVWRDSLDVEHVRSYRLSKGRGNK